MKARLRFHQKITLIRSASLEVAIAEIKVLEVPQSAHYPEGLKYSLFLVLKEDGQVLLGFDNHKPKGPHMHLGKEERPYDFTSMEQMVEDFWRLARKEGFEP